MTVTPTRFLASGEAEVPGDRPIRVGGGIPGEAAEIRVTHRGQNVTHAQFVSTPAPSPDRVDPRCAVVDQCGGCPWLHVGAARAHQERTSWVERELRGVGVSTPVTAVAPVPGERAQIKLVVEAGRLGAYAGGSHDWLDIKDCRAVSPGLAALTRVRLPQGVGRFLVARQSTVDGQVLGTLVVREAHPGLARLRVAGLHGLYVHLNRLDGDAIFDPNGPTTHRYGITSLTESVGLATVQVGPTDFFQTHPAAGRQIWAGIPLPTHALVDLYCGVGAVSLALHARARAEGRPLRSWGVETSAGAIARARTNAKAHAADATFSVGTAGATIPETFRGATVVINPPRKGTDAATRRSVRDIAPERIVMIACHPEPLARDLAEWQALGWQVMSVRTYAMFPHTPHVETVAILEPARA